MAQSSADGVGSPLGWLWTRMRAAAAARMAGAKTSRGWTSAAVSEPVETGEAARGAEHALGQLEPGARAGARVEHEPEELDVAQHRAAGDQEPVSRAGALGQLVRATLHAAPLPVVPPHGDTLPRHAPGPRPQARSSMTFRYSPPGCANRPRAS